MDQAVLIYPIEYFKKYKFIDVAVRAEGEDAFNDILTNYINKKDFSKIAKRFLQR